MQANWRIAVAAPALLGESPFWHPTEKCLYYCDIAAHRLYRYNPKKDQLTHWQFNTELASCAPFADGTLLLAMRNGLWQFDPKTQHRWDLSRPYYSSRTQRFNDGKCDPQGRFWVGTLDEQRQPNASLYCAQQSTETYQFIGQGESAPAYYLESKIQNATVSNGLAWSPDEQTLYWSDTTAHTIYAFDVDRQSTALSRKRIFAQFEKKQDQTPYGGRPDGAAVDAQGNYWVAMFEGQRLLCLTPQGDIKHNLTLPVRCPTMPCFGGPDLKTLYLTTSRHGRPEAELAEQPWAGCVLALDVDVPGLPVNFCEELSDLHRAFTPEKFAARRPVWNALSSLFLDTDVSLDRVWRVDTLAKSPYSVEQLQSILVDEVYPICKYNLLSIAGQWEGFDPVWLERKILRRLASPWRPLHAINLGRLTVHLSSEWRATKAGIAVARHSKSD
jgi:sugar lactone lactonase YvrE